MLQRILSHFANIGVLDMQNKRQKVVLAALFLLVVVELAVYGQTTQAQSKPFREASSVASWTTEKWNGNEQPYIAMRDNINSGFSHGKVTVAYLSRLEAAYNLDQHNPITLFRWAYARYRSQGLHPALPFTTMPLEGTFNEVPSPHTYNYARIRFLLETSLSRPSKLMGVGRRLLNHTPNDFDVEYALSRCYGETLSEKDKQSALAYSDRLINKYPGKPGVYAVKADVYFGCWINHRNKQDAEDAIKWYERYLQIAPANYEWREQAKSTIALLQSRI